MSIATWRSKAAVLKSSGVKFSISMTQLSSGKYLHDLLIFTELSLTFAPFSLISYVEGHELVMRLVHLTDGPLIQMKKEVEE